MDLTQLLDPVLAAKVIAVLGVLSAVKGVLAAFGNQENKFVIMAGKVVDFFSGNLKH